MAIEIEHKYLVTDSSYREMADKSFDIEQGYLSTVPERVVRVRIKGDRGFLTVKGITRGDTRAEFEYEIPVDDAKAIMSLCECKLSKRRWIVPYGGHTWEVDEFGGRHTGLVIAEIELPASNTDYPLPPFAGKNVTDDPKYFNSVLAGLKSTV